MNTVTATREVRAQIKAVRAEMKAKGIKRTSCFNGGLSGEVYRLNAQMFALETQLKKLQNDLVESTGRQLLRDFNRDLAG